MKRAVLTLLILSACASTGTVKGGLVPVDIPKDRLEAAHAPRKLALLVGIGAFDDREWRPLRYAQKDAADLARVLVDPAKGAFHQVETLNANATRDAIRGALHRLAAEDRDSEDTVVVYVSSHGTLARDARGEMRRYLVARDTEMRDVPGTGMPMDELKAEFDALRSRRKVLVLATCHSGGGKSLLPRDVQQELASTKAGFFVRPIEEVSRASVVLAACDWGETAREDESLGNDIYTHYLVEALSLGADRNGDGAVTASEAHDYARRMTYEFTGGKQRPSAESNEVGADPIVLVGNVIRRGKPEVFSYAPSLDGFTVHVDGKPLADLPGGAVVEPGRHTIQIAKGGGAPILATSVGLGPGERVDIEDLVARAEGRWEVAPRVTYLGFLDGQARADIMGPVTGLGMVATMRSFPLRRLSLRFDATVSSGQSRFSSGGQTAPFAYSAITGGVSVPFRFEMPDVAVLRDLNVFAGPRVSAFWLERRFQLALGPGPESYLVITPGMVAGASYQLGGGFTAGAELQVDWLLLRVDGQTRNSGLGQMLFGMGYRF